LFLQAAALVGVEQARILHTQFLQQKAVLIVGDAQLLTHAAQHLKAAGDVHVALGQIVAHHALVGLVPLIVAELRQHSRQDEDLIRVEIAVATALQKAPHIEAELADLAAEALGRALAAVQGRTAGIEHRPATTAALLRQGVRHHRPDRVLPVTGRRNGRRLVRCFVSLPCTAHQALAEAGSPNASASKGFGPKTPIEKRKRAAGIEPASSAWKAEVLPLNYARTSTAVPAC
jgi:hypothetical protein